MVLGIGSEIREVVTNLVFNAVDALPQGGKIRLRLRSESDHALIEIADTGAGMPAHVQAKCFEPFFTTKGPGGTGLGLSVCHGIIQRHNGHIRITSSPANGTTVHVSLPAAVEFLPADEPAVDVSLPASRVLYIDDDSRVRLVIERLLQSLGQNVDVAESGARGLEMLADNDYDLVITDLGMPDMDGKAVARAIKSAQPRLPVVMLTGWAPSLSAGSPESGEVADYVLAKPVTREELRELLARVLL